MRKQLILLLTIAMVFTLSACKETETIVEIPDHIDYLDVYYLNDFHGAIEKKDDYLGAAYIANLLKTKKEENPYNTVILSGGDMLQGSALSNYYNGLSTIDLMDDMGFDAMALGNHEFDWGLDTVTKFFDGNEENGEADFPLLSINTFYKGTENIPEGIDPYVVIERADIKIGIIGMTGSTLESSIATNKIEDYEFANPSSYILETTKYLRENEAVDLVFLLSHDSGSDNSSYENLTDEYKIDAIFNAHSHAVEKTTNNGTIAIQAGSNGKYVGHIRFTFDNGTVSETSVEHLSDYNEALLLAKDSETNDLIEEYLLETEHLFNEVLLVSNDSYSKGELSNWIAEVMAKATNSVAGFQNYGGTRATVGNAVAITPGILYDIWPFDNYIYTSEIKGSELKALIESGYYNYYADDITFDDDAYYKVATNDYIYTKTNSVFSNGINEENTGLLMRDIAYDELKLQKLIYDTFDILNDILIKNIEG
ncbi:hypothetical protein CI105_02575 [Candidatus Izimaplasma bacterium ZiA1]|uniref:bifunctional metallophosphatase/5'-nucleotidase n=1 Tax=Candidatus Izimoplasma sp. ZiA1 TaxID=2024899 RepID=UPI000BAA8CAA|nr:hypothetical protein CI105_02575 [Candidatus Izimaplasma bacterium ZiA1]